MDSLKLKLGNAICYSGYRHGQSPVNNVFPSYEEVREDLFILKETWNYIRLYDPNKHAELVLEVIKKEKLDIKVMLGVCLDAEMSNENCPWGAKYTDEQLLKNKQGNKAQIQKLVDLTKKYSDNVFAVSAGNEATVEWTDHLVSVDSVVEYVNYIKSQIVQPVTFCENYIPWKDKLKPLVDAVDFISLHTYPLWEYKHIDEAIEYSMDNYNSVKEKYPDKTIVITEAGWATKSNGRGMNSEFANEENQEKYYQKLMKWSRDEEILIFTFEAFDEDWKGSSDPLEPEKHWGLYTIDRKPKKVMNHIVKSFDNQSSEDVLIQLVS